MLFGDVIGIALSIFGFLLSLQGLWLICRAMWPNRVDRATTRCRENGVACFFLGLPVTAIALLIAVLIGRRLGTFGILFGSGLGLILLIYASIGAAGLATHLGQRLPSPADAQRPWRATVRGAVVLEMAYLIPILGWFGLLPISLIIGVGAATLGFFGSKRSPSPSMDGNMPPGAVFGSAVGAVRPLAPPRLPQDSQPIDLPELQESTR
jgi:hypothetical protein